jgi:L-lactate dehydrogenase (cytochrome)
VTVLPEIVEAVRGRAEVLLDSGVRRGSDVVKALALGAKACLIGRPYLYGLAVGGEAGARRVIEILRTEIDLCLALIGSNSVSALNESVLRSGRIPGDGIGVQAVPAELHDEIPSRVDDR